MHEIFIENVYYVMIMPVLVTWDDRGREGYRTLHFIYREHLYLTCITYYYTKPSFFCKMDHLSVILHRRLTVYKTQSI